MPNQLDLPAELLPLIEKREQDDRRATPSTPPDAARTSSPGVEQRSTSGRRAEDHADDGK